MFRSSAEALLLVPVVCFTVVKSSIGSISIVPSVPSFREFQGGLVLGGRSLERKRAGAVVVRSEARVHHVPPLHLAAAVVDRVVRRRLDEAAVRDEQTPARVLDDRDAVELEVLVVEVGTPQKPFTR